MLVLSISGRRSAAGADVDWSARLALAERYDDNITQLSQKDLDRLARPGTGLSFGCGSLVTDKQIVAGDPAKRGRFAITTPDDYITIPQLATIVRAGWLEGRPTALGLDVSAYRYSENVIKNHASYRFFIAQPLQQASDHRTTIEASYSAVPYDYLRNLRSMRAALDISMLPCPTCFDALPPPRREATYHKSAGQLRVDQEIVRKRLRLALTAGREDRNYNPCFDERDSGMPFREAELAWDPLATDRLRVRAIYRREDLHAHGDLFVPDGFNKNDVSSRRDIFGGEVRFRWGRAHRMRTIRLHYEAEKRGYNTTDPNDVFHFGRIDRRRYATLAARMDLGKGWFLAGAGERDINRSTFPVTPGSTFAPEDTTNYTENLVQFSIGYDFGLGAGGSTGRLPGTPRE